MNWLIGSPARTTMQIVCFFMQLTPFPVHVKFPYSYFKTITSFQYMSFKFDRLYEDRDMLAIGEVMHIFSLGTQKT